MLTESTITTMLPVTDSERAGHFYADSLGLKQTGKGEDGTLYFAAAGGGIGLRPMPAGAQSENTALSFEVGDLSSEISALESHGVRFQDFEMEGLKTVNHIAEMGNERAAWFNDSEGNVLCLHQVLS
ncbi:VOC family protein [Amycolatopsis sp. NPDC051128]|uniref:VOC family protein n=1 Tax=Amycolatopsis sp. NPDC051128 TaxID=3155412 RepID=UPI0034369DCB